MLKFISLGLSKVLTNHQVCCENIIIPNLLKRHSSYESSKPIPKPEDLPNYEVTQDEDEWKYVERLLPDAYIAPIDPNKYYPSGYVPQKLNCNMPYVLERTKNGMLPVYLHKLPNHMRRITRIRNVHGDLWKLANDVKKFLEVLKERKIYIKVHEICGMVIIHGDHVSDVKVWALGRGL